MDLPVLLLHGELGGWDELIIAAAAFVVLWVAVKLAGRKPAEVDDEATSEADVDDEATSEAEVDAESTESQRPPATPMP